jgi:hypothetical protein
VLKAFVFHLDPQGGRRKTARWFVPASKDEFEQELPAEWEGICSYLCKQLALAFLHTLIFKKLQLV